MWEPIRMQCLGHASWQGLQGIFCTHSITGWIFLLRVTPGNRVISSSATKPFSNRFMEVSMPSSVFSISFPRLPGANMPCRSSSNACWFFWYSVSSSSLPMYPKEQAAAIPAILPSIIAELASSMPETSPAAKIPAILQPAIFNSCDIGESPTAKQMVSTSKCCSVPGINWKWLSTSAMVTPVTWSVPSAFWMVWDK